MSWCPDERRNQQRSTKGRSLQPAPHVDSVRSPDHAVWLAGAPPISFGAPPRPRARPDQSAHGLLLAWSARRMIELAIGAADDGRQLRMVVGETVLLLLDENPASGELWEATWLASDGLELRRGGLRLRGRQPGTGGRRVFSLRATRSGEFAIGFILRRPWLDPGQARHQLRLQVAVG